MEVESQKKKYKLRFNDKQIVEIDEDIFPYFKTLSNMLEDCSGDMAMCSLEIPISVDVVTPEALEALISFYKMVVTHGIEGVGIFWPLALVDTPFMMDKEGNMNEKALYQLVAAANYLDVNDFLIYIVEHLNTLVRSWPLQKLEARHHALLKRKREERRLLPFRVHYKYELYVHDILQSMIPHDLVRGVDERITKYVNPVVCTPDITIILNDISTPNYIHINESIDVKNSHAAILAAHKILSLGSVDDEVGVGNLFITVLDQEGHLSFHGEIILAPVLRRDSDLGQARSLDEYPIPVAEVLAVWSGDNMIFALTRGGLYYWGRDKTHRRPDYVTGTMIDINPDEVLQVAIGMHHVLILTRHGLRVWGYVYVGSIFTDPNYKYYLKPSNVMHIVNETTKKEEQIEKVYASGIYSVVLAKSGILYYPRSKDNLLVTWHPIVDLPPSLPRFIALNRQYLCLIIEDQQLLVLLPSAASEGKSPTTSMMNSLSTLKDEIISYTACDSFTLIGTSHALYLSPYSPPGLKYTLPFGGTESSRSPYKLNVVFGPTGKEESILVDDDDDDDDEEERAGQRRRLDLKCDRCSAKALFMHTKQENKLFCSAYCFRKQKS